MAICSRRADIFNGRQAIDFFRLIFVIRARLKNSQDLDWSAGLRGRSGLSIDPHLPAGSHRWVSLLHQSHKSLKKKEKSREREEKD
jgi:hypothetical protein